MGLYGSKDVSNLYTDKKASKQKKKIKPFRWILAIVIGMAIFLKLGNDLDKIQTIPKEMTVESGTRLHPAKIGEVQQGNITDVVGLNSTIEIELLEVKKDKEALEMAENIHFYVELGDNQEYIFAKFRVKNIKNNSDKDIPFNFNWSNFSYATGDYRRYNYTMGLAAGGDLLEAVDLYEGAEHEGWICLYVEKVDLQPKAVFLDNLWFDL